MMRKSFSLSAATCAGKTKTAFVAAPCVLKTQSIM